jgi:hygromycin-B 4-O-kinase
MSLTHEQIQSFIDTKSGEKVLLTPVSGGDWSQAFFFEHKGSQKVIRFSASDEDFLKDQFAHRWNSSTLPIPKVEEIGEVLGGYYAISPRIDGDMVDNLPKQEMQQFAPQLIKLFDSLRTVDLSTTTGYGGWDKEGKGEYYSWGDFLRAVNVPFKSTRVTWVNELASRPATQVLFDRVYAEMIKLLPLCPEARHLIHNDLLHFNLLVKDNEVAGVIDWGCSLYGDYLYDLAMFDLWQFYYPTMEGINWKGEAKKYFEEHGADATHFDERLKCYQCHLALDAMKYHVFKGNDKDLALISGRIMEILNP